jgi:hypothetical protein
MNALPKEPLEATSPSRAESILMKIPFIGWGIAHALEESRFRPIISQYEQILRSREANEVFDSWPSEDSPVAERLMTILEEEFGWNPSLFIPRDPCLVALWAHEDGLDDVSALGRIEREWGIQFSEEDLSKMWALNLQDLVTLIKTRSQPQR